MAYRDLETSFSQLTIAELQDVLGLVRAAITAKTKAAWEHDTKMQQWRDFGPEGRTPEMEADQLCASGGATCRWCAGSGRDRFRNWCDVCLGAGTVPLLRKHGG